MSFFKKNKMLKISCFLVKKNIFKLKSHIFFGSLVFSS